MSYNIEQCASVFFISSENVSSAFKDLKSACKERDLFDGLKNVHHLDCALGDFGWALEFDDDENVIEIILLNSYYDEDEEEILFTALAPYVKAGSFIEIIGEDHETWRWVFDGVTYQTKKPTVTW